jgi:hypothetical protein
MASDRTELASEPVDNNHERRRLFKIDHIAKDGAAPTATYSRRTTLNDELLTFNSPLQSIKPSFLNLFMEKLTRGRVYCAS